jgi:hypothetical protein
MEAGGSSKTLATIYQTTRRHIPYDSNFHDHYCENLKSHKEQLCAGVLLGKQFLISTYLAHSLNPRKITVDVME